MTSAHIRRQYLDFFVSRQGHTFVPSSAVVPHEDPTLLFTNAGMNQFKPIFLGEEKRAYTRAVNSQKCIRAGGKHNDLDDVGRSRRHHTFFEMLGNWSFGDYFKQGAIEMAWELLTGVWKLDPTRLHVSCFEGDEKNGVPRDTEAADIWRKVIGLPAERIHYFGKDNFWEMGETGPCGPCTEIYIDRTPDKTGGGQVNGDDPRVMEIWNLVFIQYNRNPDRSLTPLPARHVDTGMGFERICQVLQDKPSNYDIDLFDPYWARLKELTGHTYGGLFPRTNAADPAAEAADANLRKDIAFRVIADHLRCLTFALTDGAVPSNEGRGYVLRRILRRAVRFGRQTLELRQPFLHTLVPVVIESMGQAFPELKKNPRLVEELIREEEISFGRTLDRGIELFDQAADRAAQGAIHAEDAFKLHDTYGFPIDLTRIMAEERGMTVDIAGYEQLMEEARQRARAAGREGASRVFELPPNVLSELAEQGIAPTEDSAKFADSPIRATVKAIWNGSNTDPSADTSGDQEIAVILDKTNFYAEMGGQVGDRGTLSGPGGELDVEATRQVGGYVLHIGRVRRGVLAVGDSVQARVADVRALTKKNHTATHLANWALREVLGEGVQQKGSLVDPEKLRFDFSHNKALAEAELERIEALVDQSIQQGLAVDTQVVPQEKALKIPGLRAVFGEKYPPSVRVVSIGAPVDRLLADPANAQWRNFSIEFCGGTHLANTAEAGGFVITGEESVSKGIRRIVALTGDSARATAQRSAELVRTAEQAGRATDAELPAALAALNKRLAEAEVSLRAKRQVQAIVAELQNRAKQAEKSGKKQSAGGGIDVGALSEQLLSQAVDLLGVKVVVAEVKGAQDDQLRGVIDSIKKKQPAFAALLASAGEAKVSFVAAVSDDAIAKGLKAGDWVREAARATGGGGGGRPQMAQAGGKDPARLPEALDAAQTYARKVLRG